MATPTVTLTFAGDTTDLDQAFSDASSSADRMARDVESSSKKAADAGAGGLDRVGESADGAEGKFIGLADVISGAGDTMTAFQEGDVAGLAMGLADMAGGIAAFVVPVLGTVAGAISTAATATWGFTTALLANPLTWVVVGVVALIAAIVLLIVYWDEVKAAAVTAINWIGDRFQWVLDRGRDFWNWLKQVPGWIGSAFASVASSIAAPFRAAFNFVADAWNNTIGRLSWRVPDWVPFIGGNTIAVPRLPRFHTGGLVPGNQGSEMLAVLQAGERVIPRGQAAQGGATEVRFTGNVDSAFATAFMRLVRSGDIQVVTA